MNMRRLVNGWLPNFPGSISIHSLLWWRKKELPPLPKAVCDDPDDDMFLACAIASRAEIIISGDRALLRASGYGGVEVLSPRTFVDRYLEKP